MIQIVKLLALVQEHLANRRQISTQSFDDKVFLSPTNTAKEEITKSLDVAAVKAPAIQKETAHDDTDEPPPDDKLADDWSDAAN